MGSTEESQWAHENDFFQIKVVDDVVRNPFDFVCFRCVPLKIIFIFEFIACVVINTNSKVRAKSA